MKCFNLRQGKPCRYGDRCIFNHFSELLTQGDQKASSMGAPAVDPNPSKLVVCQVGSTDVEEWALDTAAACDVAGEDVQGTTAESAVPVSRWSAGGVVYSSSTVTTEVPGLGETVTAKGAPRHPKCLGPWPAVCGTGLLHLLAALQPNA